MTPTPTTAPAPVFTIGQLARRTGVPVRTIRFWSDEGVLPETERSAAGYRRYDAAAVARLDLVAALRDLGLGLPEVRAVLDRHRGVDEVAAAHVRAIDDRIRILRVQRAVCTLLARGGHDDREVRLMNDLARLSAAQRQQLIDEFVDATFADTDPDAPGAGIAGAMRSMPVELPDDPSVDQLEAWVELAELVGDESFRARVREMAVAGSQAPATAPDDTDPAGADPALVTEHAGAALAAGVAPGSAQAEQVLARIGVGGLDAAARAALADRMATFTDARVERYWTLLGRLNGWPERPPAVPAFEWFIAAMRARPVTPA